MMFDYIMYIMVLNAYQSTARTVKNFLFFRTRPMSNFLEYSLDKSLQFSHSIR
jgi:hypothetical protein